jgi:hypothetical protein
VFFRGGGGHDWEVVTELEPDCDWLALLDEPLPDEPPLEPVPDELLPLSEPLVPDELPALPEPLEEPLLVPLSELLDEPSSEPLLVELSFELVVLLLEPLVVLAPPSSLWLCEPLDPDDVVLVAAVVELPPLPRAATASQAATKVASTPAATRRRRVRRRRLMGGVGSCMSTMVDPEPWILLGIRSGSRKSLRVLFDGS